LAHELAIPPMVEGMAAFLQEKGYTFYVCSSAPEAEVHCQLEQRNLLPYFTKVYGSTVAKADALCAIRAVHPDGAIVFFGDAVSDWAAAQSAVVAFIGVVNERDNFGDQPVMKLHNFVDQMEVEEFIELALQTESLNQGKLLGRAIIKKA